MRPVDRGAPLVLASNNYRDAFLPLQERLGAYCSYCERYLATNLAIEHIQPKSLNPALELAWENFLLGCVNCNSSKGATTVAVNDFLWPDRNNTLLALSYESGIVKNALPTTHPAYLKVNALIKLCGLDKFPGNPEQGRKPSTADMRWKSRSDTLGKANRARKNLAANDTLPMREQIVETAQSQGGFSIWFEVFKNDADMRLRLIAAFPGTATDCFDNGSPIPKPGAEL
jgi:hypothetical protein